MDKFLSGQDPDIRIVLENPEQTVRLTVA